MRFPLRCSSLGVLLALWCGCTVPEGSLSGKACPCADGWACDSRSNVCVPAGLLEGRTNPRRGDDAGVYDEGGPEEGPQGQGLQGRDAAATFGADAAMAPSHVDGGGPSDSGQRPASGTDAGSSTESGAAVDPCPDDSSDSDGDRVVDCRESCPMDPLKLEPGSCGCGAADVDADMDGIADCGTPRALGARLWYEARDIQGDGGSIADGTPITRLVDKSEHANHADLAEGSAATLGTEQGHRVLQLGSAVYLTSKSLGDAPNTDLEVHFVLRLREGYTDMTILASNSAMAEQSSSLKYTVGPLAFFGKVFMDLPGSDRLGDLRWPVTTATPRAWMMRSSTTQGRVIAIDGTVLGQGGSRTGTGPLLSWYIGGLNEPLKLAQADLHAFIVFDRTLTSLERARLFKFMEARYGITLP